LYQATRFCRTVVLNWLEEYQGQVGGASDGKHDNAQKTIGVTSTTRAMD
jgi:hypothetical protein